MFFKKITSIIKILWVGMRSVKKVKTNKLALAQSLGEKTKVYFKREEKNSSQQEAGWRALRPIQPLPFFSKRGLSSNATSIKSLSKPHSHQMLLPSSLSSFSTSLSSNATSIKSLSQTHSHQMLLPSSLSQTHSHLHLHFHFSQFDRRSLSFLFSGCPASSAFFSLCVRQVFFFGTITAHCGDSRSPLFLPSSVYLPH